MEWSEVLNLVLGGSLMGAVVTIVTLRSTIAKSEAEARRAEADAESLRMDNAEHATRILMENITKPLKEELNDTRLALKESCARWLRCAMAVDAANGCRGRDGCPVLMRLQEQQEHGGDEPRGADGCTYGERRGDGFADGAGGAGCGEGTGGE